MCKTDCDVKCKLYHIFSWTSIASVEPVCKENIISCRRNQYESKEGTHHTEKEVNQYIHSKKCSPQMVFRVNPVLVSDSCI